MFDQFLSSPATKSIAGAPHPRAASDPPIGRDDILEDTRRFQGQVALTDPTDRLERAACYRQGVIGLIRFLPLSVAMPVGEALAAAGLFSAFFAAYWSGSRRQTRRQCLPIPASAKWGCWPLRSAMVCRGLTFCSGN